MFYEYSLEKNNVPDYLEEIKQKLWNTVDDKANLVNWCFQKMKEKPENGEDFFKFVNLLSEKSDNWKLGEMLKICLFVKPDTKVVIISLFI